jgi:hypothetical protein
MSEDYEPYLAYDNTGAIIATILCIPMLVAWGWLWSYLVCLLADFIDGLPSIIGWFVGVIWYFSTMWIAALVIFWPLAYLFSLL